MGLDLDFTLTHLCRLQIKILMIVTDRFRSITKQYFRKADGVVVMYDVSSESTFKNVRQWMDSVMVDIALLYTQPVLVYLVIIRNITFPSNH